MILGGQIRGGVAQGIGNAFDERLAYDENGQLLNARSWIFTCPRAWMCRASTPDMEKRSHHPMGVKDAGAIPVGPLFAQALEDALHDVDFEILEIPLNSNKLWELVNSK